MTLTYNNNVPAGPDDPADDQPQMLVNTQSINSILDVDHFTFVEPNSGFHRQVTFPQNFTPSVPTSPPVLFTALDPNNLPQLFWYSGGATKTTDQYKNGLSNASFSSTFAFGGIIIKTGVITLTLSDQARAHATEAETFAALGVSAFPNKCLTMTATLNTTTSGTTVTDATLFLRTYDQTGFTWVRNVQIPAIGPTFASFNWIAIGF